VLELRQQFPLAGLLRLAGLARSTFYYQRVGLAAADKYAELKARIREIFNRHKGRYGYRRVTAALRQIGQNVNHKTVQRLMSGMQLRAVVRVKRFRRFEGNGSHVAPNLLQRDFRARRPHEKWVTDVTEFKVRGQKLYLSPIMDLYNGEIVAYDTAELPMLGMVENMLRGALKRLCPHERPVLHSDQGWQYRMPAFRQHLERHSILQSMSRSGNCLDNAAMESFFGTLKSEFFHLTDFESIEQLRDGLHEYIRYYNEDRIKLKLGTSPIDFRMRSVAA
jgi:putative transposase